MNETLPPDEPTGSCLVCARRDPHRGLVCDADRSWLAGLLGDLRILHEQLSEDEPEVVDSRVIQRRIGDWRVVHAGGGTLVPRRRDWIAYLTPAAPIAGLAGGGRGTNPPESRPPVSLDPLDIAGRANSGSWTPYAKGVNGLDADQIGYLPLATVLDLWVRCWCAARGRGEVGSGADVDTLTHWLSERLNWACDEYLDIAEMAEHLHVYRRTMRALLGLNDFPRRYPDVPCPECDERDLHRMNGCLWIECGCGVMMSPDEFDEWTKSLLDPRLEAA